MKILALFLLSGFFLFFAAAGVVPLYAQHYRGMIPDSYQELRTYDRVGIKSDEQNAIEDLEKSNHDLKAKLHKLETSNDLFELEILNLQDKLKQTEVDLHTAKVRIETLELRLTSDHEMWDRLLTLFTAPPARRPASQTKAPVNKPKPAVDSLKDR